MTGGMTDHVLRPTREQQLEEALRALVDALPRCDIVNCDAVAVAHDQDYEPELYCAEHTRKERLRFPNLPTLDLPTSAPLRAALALLDGE